MVWLDVRDRRVIESARVVLVMLFTRMSGPHVVVDVCRSVPALPLAPAF